ncbi:MAG TPA: tetratricopeptide repeat protein [Kofleriaceae bacterium]|nr:tetratricopeptide repeat protein [Kofleriaceae bacterium]
MRTLVVIATLAALAGTALAQSKRYPPEPADKDEEAAQKSSLWESATNPHRRPYESAIAEAQQLLEERTPENALLAIAKLDEAIKLMPDEPKAYRIRGDAFMVAKDWAKCTADLQAALAHTKRVDAEAKNVGEVRKRLGLCQARAGKLADAERTLAEAAASGGSSGEVWMRLGEVRIAMGKLEEAIAALEAAADQTDVSQAMVRWLLAGAYDRARRPSDAAEKARKALEIDRDASTLRANTLPYLGTGERDYLLGLAYSNFDPPKPEYALMYFRRFLKIAADSPWRKRAEDHVKELKATVLPETVERRSGAAQVDLEAARAAVRKLMPQLRACLAKAPNFVLEVQITKVGPRTPAAPGARRTYAPPEGITILASEPADPSNPPTQADKDTAIRCVEPIAAKIALPAVKDKDAYYKAVFSVVAP